MIGRIAKDAVGLIQAQMRPPENLIATSKGGNDGSKDR